MMSSYRGGVYNQLVDVIATQKLSGEDLMAMTQAQFVTVGVPFGLAREFVSDRSKWFAPFVPGTHAVAAVLAKQWGPAGLEVAGMAQAETLLKNVDRAPGLWPAGAATQIQVGLTVENVFSVTEVDYEFEVQFQMMLSWFDPNVFSECSLVGVDQVSSGCPGTWRPTVRFLNAKGEVEIETQTFYAMPVGMIPGAPAICFLVARYHGTFMAPMSFRKFPSDVQQLPIEFAMAFEGFNVDRRQLVLDPLGTLSPLLEQMQADEGKDTISGWRVLEVTGEEFVYAEGYQQHPANFGRAGSAFAAFAGAMAANGYALTEQSASATRFSIKIERLAGYYLLNYVMIVVLLTAVSWLAFFIDPMSLDARLGVALTLLLAIGVFQLILNDSMPKTGYLTPMHTFIIVSNFYVVLVCAESLALFQLRKAAVMRELVVAKLKASGFSPTGRGAGVGSSSSPKANAVSPLPPPSLEMQDGGVEAAQVADEPRTRPSRWASPCGGWAAALTRARGRRRASARRCPGRACSRRAGRRRPPRRRRPAPRRGAAPPGAELVLTLASGCRPGSPTTSTRGRWSSSRSRTRS
jgi:hypothetical protein